MGGNEKVKNNRKKTEILSVTRNRLELGSAGSVPMVVIAEVQGPPQLKTE